MILNLLYRHIKVIVFGLIIFIRLSNSLMHKIVHKFQSLVDEDAIYKSYRTAKACECQKSCYYDDECWSFSWVKTDNSFMCSLGRTVSLQPSNITTIGSGVKRVANRYKKGSNEPQNFETAVKLCSNMSGYRLGIYKTVNEFEELVEISKMFQWETNGVWVNLHIDSASSIASWDDGTKFVDTELGLDPEKYILQNNEDTSFKFRLNSLKFDDFFSTSLYHVLCQRI